VKKALIYRLCKSPFVKLQLFLGFVEYVDKKICQNMSGLFKISVLHLKVGLSSIENFMKDEPGNIAGLDVHNYMHWRYASFVSSAEGGRRVLL
jgi:hypothetical protein